MFGGRYIRGWSADNRQVRIGKRELTCGRMVVHGLRGQKGNIFFPFAGYFHYYRELGYVFLEVMVNYVNIVDKKV